MTRGTERALQAAAYAVALAAITIMVVFFAGTAKDDPPYGHEWKCGGRIVTVKNERRASFDEIITGRECTAVEK